MNLRSLLIALAVSIAATAVISIRARATNSSAACGPWQLCFCRQLDCRSGAQLCAEGDGFTCYQDELTKQ